MIAVGMKSISNINLPLFRNMPPISMFFTLVVYVTNSSTALPRAKMNGPVNIVITTSPVPTAAIESNFSFGT